MSFVDFESLIAKNFDQLINYYEMRWTQQNFKNPSNYTPQQVMKIVKKYIDELPIQEVLILGYISADQKGLLEQIFPRAIDELAIVEKILGQIKVLYAITEQPLNSEINDPEWILQKPGVLQNKKGMVEMRNLKIVVMLMVKRVLQNLIFIIINRQRVILLKIWLMKLNSLIQYDLKLVIIVSN
ncbi:unnamed protein product [Paramecium pentaurelia]|uniref:Uncharacterized protein n=1 Tax=Paramecium pentaurelia TaxID=43138 RepID=A0A8S1SMF2_9CILI|nr:unnamed protein product [Paramecium pentaurelia]